jgi:hypothetical protein
MAIQSSDYSYYVIRSFYHTGGGTSNPIEACPIAGQGLDTSMRVECSEHMRNSHPVGTLFKIRAKVTNRQGGRPFLYTNYRWDYEVLTEAVAELFVKQNF